MELTDEERLRRVQNIVKHASVDRVTGQWALDDWQIEQMLQALPESMHDDFKKSMDRNMEWKIKKMTINDMIHELRRYAK